jgi:hypothetical protein
MKQTTNYTFFSFKHEFAHVCMPACKLKIVDNKISHTFNGKFGCSQLRLSELIENSVGLPAATSKGNITKDLFVCYTPLLYL